MKKRLLAVDPSINNLGAAIYDRKKKKLIYAKLLHPAKAFRKSFEDKSFSLYGQIVLLVEKYSVKEVVIEIPEHWDVAGYMSRESGSIQKTIFITGMIYSLRLLMPMTAVTPRGYKGQLPKEVVRNRLRREFVPKYYTLKEWRRLNHNILDSLAIGYWKLYGRV